MNTPGKYKILIADDDTSDIKDIVNVLIKNSEYTLLTTGNGKSACQITDAESPDLIIMDWQMPVMSGIEAILQLKKSESTKDIPIIISTGIMIDSKHLSTALGAGAVDYLRKPVDAIELTARVENMLKLSEAYLKNKQQNIELQHQLTSKLINIQQLNELKTATIKQLTIIKQQASVAKNQPIQDSINQTEGLLYSKAYQTDWENFQTLFELIHQNFFIKLKEIFGEFTPHELRLTAFIKLNMSSKDIASIIYTSPASVDTARKRLKKKLGLPPHESLQFFIHNL